MCGIVGQMVFDGQPIDERVFERMVEVLGRRGPDDRGMFFSERVVLGHTRLAIIDPSDGGKQPLIDTQLGLAIVFNGCIYNHDELRNELVRQGYVFRTKSDTEVLLKCFHAWGDGCLSRLNGIFAFCIYDFVDRSCFLARDRLGVKPLYYSLSNESIVFSSTPQAILESGLIDPDVDPFAIHHYMSLHGIIPPPRSIFERIKKVPPACFLKVSDKLKVEQRSYWDVSYSRNVEEETRSIGEWAEILSSEIKRSCRRNLVSDRRIGVLLSGGVDSSLIAAICSNEVDLTTFSIGFEDVDDLKGNEFAASDFVSSRLPSRHEKIKVTSNEVESSIVDVIGSMSEPMVSHDCIGFYLLFKTIKSSCAVTLSGQGADEVFAGYHWYPKLVSDDDLFAHYSELYFDTSHDAMHNKLKPAFVINGDVTGDLIRAYLKKDDGATGLDKVLKNDIHRMLPEDPVKRLDNMAGAWGVEARVPFLDHQLVELAAKMPPKAKLAFGGKGVLKVAAEGSLENQIIYREKGYFPVPQLKKLKGGVFDLVRDCLHSRRARERGIFEQSFIDELLEQPDRHATPLGGSVLWKVASLELWLQSQGI